ncbi:MAG: iron-containing alcohol dehydrogenase [Sedimentibacter sp.]
MNFKFSIHPQIYELPSLEAFFQEFNINEKDLLFINKFSYNDFFKDITLPCHTLFCEDYTTGEPSDSMVDALLKDIKNLDIDRVIGVGGGTVLDVAKLLSLKDAESADDIYEDKIPLIRDKQLVLVPTTCGTGCEMTAVSVIDRPKYKAKIGKRIECNFADAAVLIPELLSKIPHKVFAFSSIDALIHAMEIYVTPYSSSFSQVFCLEAVRMIVKGFMEIAEKGSDYKFEIMDQFLLGSAYAGVALSNDPCGAVHASAMHFGGEHHVAHGESNYCFLTAVFTVYSNLKPEGRVATLAQVIRETMGIDTDLIGTFEALNNLLNKITPRKGLREYGIPEEKLPYYVDKVFETQQRILRGNYVPMTKEQYLEIYKLAY